ncbi:uncharacterized protein LOC121401661 [Xenopus laevis]|uniref:Uncharacterized protein LOC121401661 n=1 Tax=Xenopus laevis TaxID=8355 RepID=A0A8J1MPE8_XENLA|nr:uncharacterized protein LOC121401661 [Xenopus laevis]
MSGLLVLCSTMIVWGATAGKYCTEQVLNIESFPGDSITIPCGFVYPRSINPVSEVEIAWRAGPHHYCGSEIYNKTRNYTAPKYQGRLSVIGDPQTGNVALTLVNVTAADEVKYCCRILLRLPDGTTRQWQSSNGTKLTIRGPSDMIVHQPPLIPALAGDAVTIPCHFSTNDKVGKMSMSSVQWGYGRYSACGTVIYNSTTGFQGNNLEGQISLAGLASIQIHQVKPSNSGWYCCKLQVNGDGKFYSRERNIGTHLVIKDRTSELNIRQPGEVTFSSSASISCSFSLLQDNVPLWIKVYWMFGNTNEGFAYHPDSELIHPRYRGKTRLVGQSDLFLEQVYGMDNTTFYCRVAMRLCKATDPYRVDILIEEGAGTLLRVHDVSSDWILYAIITVRCVLICIIIPCGILGYVKLRGQIHKNSHLKVSYLHQH